MPTMSSSFDQPLVTPSTELLTSARTSPWMAAFESSSRTTFRVPSFCSNFTPPGKWVTTSPLGPFTRTVLPSTAYVTPLGNGIGFFPILDMLCSQVSCQLSAVSYQLNQSQLKQLQN